MDRDRFNFLWTLLHFNGRFVELVIQGSRNRRLRKKRDKRHNQDFLIILRNTNEIDINRSVFNGSCHVVLLWFETTKDPIYIEFTLYYIFGHNFCA